LDAVGAEILVFCGVGLLWGEDESGGDFFVREGAELVDQRGVVD